LVLALLAFGLLASTVNAADYYVPDDYATIQEAIDAVDPGDHINVRPGTYAGFRYNGKAVTVESLEGPTGTTISGSVRFWDDESQDSKLIGFSITGGDGALISFSAGASGSASGYVESCILSSSAHTGIDIGGSGDPLIVDVEVSQCSIGIEIRDTSEPWIGDSKIHENATRGIDVQNNARPELYRCRISDNDREGVVYGSPVTGSLDNCIINYSGDWPVYSSGLALLNNARVTLTNCVVDNNMGDGCDLGAGSTSAILNCIVTNNGNYGVYGGAGATSAITYTCFRNNIHGDLGGSATAGGGCIFTNPLFIPGGDYYLSDPDSPCIDAGDPGIEDLLRPPGLGGTRSDMGAYGGSHNGPGPRLVRADVDASGEVNISDPLYSLAYQFAGGPAPVCMDAADTDDSGEVNISDPLYSLAYQFAGGPQPPAPFPGCGPDPTADVIGCDDFPPCGGDARANRPAVATSSAGDRVFWRPVPGVSRERIQVEFGVETSRELAAFEFTATYDFSVLEFLRLDPAPGVELDFLSASEDAGTATLRVGGVPDLGLQAPLDPGAHPIGLLRFRVLEPAALSSRWFELVSARFVYADRSEIFLAGGEGCAPAGIPPIAGSGSAAGRSILHVPNPYRTHEAIRLSLPGASRVEIAVFDVSGRRVRMLLEDGLRSGDFALYWDGSTDDGEAVHTGVYYVQVRLDGFWIKRKILLIE
jgi:hypothetical protein